MYPSYLLRLLLGASLLLLILTACQESDVLYGPSPDDYVLTGTAADAAARNYFRQKEIACVTDKAGIEAAYPRGWISAQLIVRAPDGSIDVLPTTQVAAQLRADYESLTGGRLVVSTLSRLGYRHDFTLFPCDVKDSYFYLADFSADGAAATGVVAYSVASASLPLAYELGYEFHDPISHTLVEHEVVGLTISAGQTGRVLPQTLGSTGYLVYLLRREGRCRTHFNYWVGPEYSLREGRGAVLDCSGVKLNGTAVHTLSVADNFEAQGGAEAPGVHLFNDASSQPLARFGDAPQSANVSNTPLRVSAVRGGTTIHAYATWAWLGIPFSHRLTFAW